jgi:eukaryotic-like serine/threonine-protein kinase
MRQLKVGRAVAGRYRLESELARGGMGVLWHAIDESLGRRVVIKFIQRLDKESEEPRARFAREAQAAAQIRSPHAIQIYDYGIDRDVPYLVMELLCGEDLGVRLRREARLPLQAVSRILDQLAVGLDVVHGAGIIHRDIKPANIFLNIDSGTETVKLIDFGLARTSDSSGYRTKTGQAVGTLYYMSPEQARGVRQLDHRSDLWSLAVVLYRAVTGEHPFRGKSFARVVNDICEAPILAPSRLVGTLPADIDAFFLRALNRNRMKRFQSGRQMAAAFTLLSRRPARTTLPWGHPALGSPQSLSSRELTPGMATRSALLSSGDQPTTRDRIVPWMTTRHDASASADTSLNDGLGTTLSEGRVSPVNWEEGSSKTMPDPALVKPGSHGAPDPASRSPGSDDTRNQPQPREDAAPRRRGAWTAIARFLGITPSP